MSREILFRGKREDNGEWVQGFLFCIWNEAYILCGTTNGVSNMIEVIPETVGQYTGFTDKNDEMIFEGDIVKTGQYGREDGFGRNFCGEDRFIVVFADGAYRLQRKSRRFNLVSGADKEVIGNIYDNPEILKEGEKI